MVVAPNGRGSSATDMTVRAVYTPPLGSLAGFECPTFVSAICTTEHQLRFVVYRRAGLVGPLTGHVLVGGRERHGNGQYFVWSYETVLCSTGVSTTTHNLEEVISRDSRWTGSGFPGTRRHGRGQAEEPPGNFDPAHKTP